MTIREDALAEDEDALRLLSGVLRVDGQRIALPRVQLAGRKSAQSSATDGQC